MGFNAFFTINKDEISAEMMVDDIQLIDERDLMCSPSLKALAKYMKDGVYETEECLRHDFGQKLVNQIVVDVVCQWPWL